MAQRSKFTRGMTVLVATTALLSAPLATVAAANQATSSQTQDQAAPANTDADYATQKEFLKASEEGLQMLSQVHQARAELYEGQHDAATKLLDDANKTLGEAETTMQQLLVADTDGGEGKPTFLPVDVRIGFGESFVATPEADQALSEAGDQLKAQQPDQALETLRVAELDMEVIAAMVPLDQTSSHLSDARKALEAGDTDTAQQALAAIEEGVVVRGWGIDAIPQQGPAAENKAQADPAPATSSDATPSAVN